MQPSTISISAAVEKKILTAIELKKELEQYEREIKAELQEVMVSHNIKSINNDNYVVSLVERPTYKADDLSTLDPSFIKPTLDTTKVGAYLKLNGTTPEGITTSNTMYVSWRAK